jgi:hypothetical protein
MSPENSDTVTGTVTKNDQQTAIFTEIEAVKLHLGLKLLNGSIAELEKANILTKAAKAEAVLNDARDLLATSVFITHAALNEISRLNKRLERIEAIGVIKNG